MGDTPFATDKWLRLTPAEVAELEREGIRFVARDPYLRVLSVSGAAGNIGLIGRRG